MYPKGTKLVPTTEMGERGRLGVGGGTRAIGYVRVSTDVQAQEGVSLDAQRERIRAYCNMCGICLLEIISDDLSGKSLERPGLRKALSMLDKGRADAIVVVKIDRLTRSVLDLGILLQQYFLKESYYLLSVTESLDTRNAIGRFVLYILALIAQWEREAISERTRDAMRHLKANGIKLGQAPYGYRYGQALDAHGWRVMESAPEEQAVIAQIVGMLDRGKGKQEICAP